MNLKNIKIAFLSLFLLSNNYLSSFVLSDVTKHSQDIYNILPELKQSMNIFVLDTKMLYSHISLNFENILSCSRSIQETEDVFEKIDLSLSLLNKQFAMLGDMIEVLKASAGPVKQSSNLLKPFFPIVAADGSNIADNMESVSVAMEREREALGDVIKPLRESIDKIVCTIRTLAVDPKTKKSDTKKLDEDNLGVVSAAKKFKAITRKYGKN